MLPGSGRTWCRDRVRLNIVKRQNQGQIAYVKGNPEFILSAQKLRSRHCAIEQFLRTWAPKTLISGTFWAWHIICKTRRLMHPVSLQDTRVLNNVKPQQDKLK